MKSVSMLLILATIWTQPCGASDSIISGEQAGRQVHVLSRQIKWHTSLEDARKAAKQQNRLVFWVHMLGHIDGKT